MPINILGYSLPHYRVSFCINDILSKRRERVLGASFLADLVLLSVDVTTIVPPVEDLNAFFAPMVSVHHPNIRS